jgi:CarD family transcriptional regulator
MPSNWNQRYRSNLERLKSGDIFEVANVVRDLTLLNREKGLSMGEKKMLTNAKNILISEMVIVKDTDSDAIDQKIEATIVST